LDRSVRVEPPVIQGKSRRSKERDVLYICGIVLDCLNIKVGRGLKDLFSLS
jgi:hypothetical protein